MRKRLFPICMMLLAIVASCGESAKERHAREEAEARHKADSIALVEAEQAKKVEQLRQDSITSALKRAERMAADSAVRAKLLPTFVEEKNADASGASLYRVKQAPKNHLQNYAYLSFSVDNGVAREMFINICYNGKDWLNIDRGSVAIDGEDPIDLSFSKDQVSNKVNDNLTCSEWFTVPIYSNIYDKILEGKKVTVKLTGDDSTKTINLTTDQVTNMQKTIKLFQAFGG